MWQVRLARLSAGCPPIGPARPARAWRICSWWCAMTDALFVRARPVPRASRRHLARCTPIGCRGSPSSNAAVAVEAVGFAPWKRCWLGVMVTPWSMRVPARPARNERMGGGTRLQEKRRYTFPAGHVRLHRRARGRDRRIPDLLAFLPAARICRPRDGAANRTARARSAFRPLPTPRQRRCRPASTASATASSEVPKPLARLEASLATPMSRRDLLRARFSGNVDEPRR